VAYDTPEGRTSDFPIDLLDEPEVIKPVYETLDGWSESLAEVRSRDDLPRAAREYLRFLEHESGVPLCLILRRSPKDRDHRHQQPIRVVTRGAPVPAGGATIAV